MIGQPTRIRFDDPDFWRKTYHSQYDPHWATKILLDPRGDRLDSPEFMRDLAPEISSRIDFHLERALDWFDTDALGWVPRWFPKRLITEDEFRDLTPEERLAWFDKALAYYSVDDWPPSGQLGNKKRAVAKALLSMLRIHELDCIPPPEKM